MAIGAFSRQRRAVRQYDNPLDKCTIVSIFPKELDVTKETIQPGRFIIPPGSYESPSILVVGSSSWWRDVEENQPLLEIPNSAIQIANSIITDYCNGILACDMDSRRPGFFYLTGTVTHLELKSKYKPDMDAAKARQDNWYRALLEMADTIWSTTNGNPSQISDYMKIAARALVQEREWLSNYHAPELIRCVACGAMRNPNFPICGSCHTVIDVEKYSKLNLKPAETK